MDRFGRNNPGDRGSVVLMSSARQSRIRNRRSILDDLLRAARDLIAAPLLDSAAQAARRFLRRSLAALLRTSVAAVLVGTGSVFLLIGGVEALRAMRLPDAAAYAIMGAVAFGAGLAALSSAGSRNDSDS